jgi:hypothetical protein
MALLKERFDRGWDYDPDSDNDRYVMEGIRTVLATQTKVDDTRLRRRQTDMLPRLLEILAKEERKLPVLDLVANPS